MEQPNKWYAYGLQGMPPGSIWVWGVWSDNSVRWIRLDPQDGSNLATIATAQSLTGGHPVSYTKGGDNFTDIAPFAVVGLPGSDVAGQRPGQANNWTPNQNQGSAAPAAAPKAPQTSNGGGGATVATPTQQSGIAQNGQQTMNTQQVLSFIEQSGITDATQNFKSAADTFRDAQKSYFTAVAGAADVAALKAAAATFAPQADTYVKATADYADKVAKASKMLALLPLFNGQDSATLALVLAMGNGI